MTDETIQVQDQTSNGVAPNYESLARRAQERRRQLEQHHSVIMEPPGFKGLLAVEYRVLTFSDVHMINERHERIQDGATQALYVAADSLILASINSYAIEDGQRVELGLRWGRELAEALGYEMDERFTARRALFACFPRDMAIMTHYGEYSAWLTDAEEDVDREQAEDFPASR